MTAWSAEREITEAAQEAGKTPKTRTTKVMQRKEIRERSEGAVS